MEIPLVHHLGKKQIITNVMMVLLLSGCVVPESLTFDSSKIREERDYRADDLIQEWRESVEGKYPVDNDADYAYPQPLYRQAPVIVRQPNYNSPYRYTYPSDNDAAYQAPYVPNNQLPYPSIPGSGNDALLPTDNDAEYNYPLYFDE